MQTAVRGVVFLLVTLVAISAVFELDIVLGAFAAGFILRYMLPEGNEHLEQKLEGIAFGFFIPFFFVVSGGKIDLSVLIERPLVILSFVALLLIVRAVPIYFSLGRAEDTRLMSNASKANVALYCTTSLPIIVAVCSIAVNAGAMSETFSSTIVLAGACTVLFMPLLASIVMHLASAHALNAVVEIGKSPSKLKTIIAEHIALDRKLNEGLDPEDTNIRQAIMKQYLEEKEKRRNDNEH